MDIWDIEVKVGEGGEIRSVGPVRIKDKSNKEIIKNMKTPFVTIDDKGDEVISRIWNRKLVNYCSIGIDARIGLGFDKKRTKSRFCNKVVYAWEGVKKLCCVGGGGLLRGKIERMEVLIEADENSGSQTKIEDLPLDKSIITSNFNKDKQNEGNEIIVENEIQKRKIGRWNLFTKTVLVADEKQAILDQKMINPLAPKKK